MDLECCLRFWKPHSRWMATNTRSGGGQFWRCRASKSFHGKNVGRSLSSSSGKGGRAAVQVCPRPVSFPSAVVIGFSSRVPVLVYFSKFRDVFAQVNSCICKPRAPVSPVRPSRVSPSRPLPGISLVTLSAWVQSDFRMASEHLSVSTHGFIRVCCVRCQALCSARRRQMPVSPPSRSKQSRKGEN